MDPKLLYLILLQLSLWGVGAGAVAVAVLLYHQPRRWWAYVLTKLSLAGIIGVIMTLIWDTGEVDPRPASLFYTILVLLGALGMTFVAGDIAKRGGILSAENQVAQSKVDRQHERVTVLEDRVTKEEARNTDIEDVAKKLHDRVDDTETAAEEHGTSRPEEHDH